MQLMSVKNGVATLVAASTFRCFEGLKFQMELISKNIQISQVWLELFTL